APRSYTAVRLLFRGVAELPFTNPVIWSSSDQNVITVNAQGMVTAVAAGTAVLAVRSASGPAQGSTTLTVADTALKSLTISPASASVPKGLSLALQATGKFTDDSTQDLTNVVAWASSDSTIVTMSNAFGSQ